MAKSKVKFTKGNDHSKVWQKRRGRVQQTSVEVFKDSKGQWRFRLKAANGEIIAQSEGYTRRYTAHQGAKRVLAAAP